MEKKTVISELVKAFASGIPFADLSRFLPFQTRVVSGRNYNHIQSCTAYDVTTYGRPFVTSFATSYPEYTVSEGDTLCRRGGRLLSDAGGFMNQNCPGCLRIAQGIIKRDVENA